ncbi:hypothetical protein C0992_003122, partial [Termitomyces sp. T32_za158]
GDSKEFGEEEEDDDEGDGYANEEESQVGVLDHSWPAPEVFSGQKLQSDCNAAGKRESVQLGP